MRIKELTLRTAQLEKQKAFYEKTLGFNNIKNEQNGFSLQVGFTKLKFSQSEINHRYHYCFLIPSNQLEESIGWLKERLYLVKIEDDLVVQRFESWNADSIYFYDGSGSLVEFIVRYDLKNESNLPFSNSSILGVNEIGMPTSDIEATNRFLEHKLNSVFWKGDRERFGTHGNQEGLFLLPNYNIKKTWFPTQMKITSPSFESIIEVEEKKFRVAYEKEALRINPL